MLTKAYLLVVESRSLHIGFFYRNNEGNIYIPAVVVYAANFVNFYLQNDTSLSIPILRYHCSLRFSGNQDVSAFPER